MSDFTLQHFQHVAEQAKANGQTIAEGLKQCFDKSYSVEATDPVAAPPLPKELF
ncbi:MAG: hypothetical protein R3C11_27855 [Planctomycetaceae bacterium]